MEKLLSFKQQSSPYQFHHHHLTTATPPHHHRSRLTHRLTFTHYHPVSLNAIFKPNVVSSCTFHVPDHGEFRKSDRLLLSQQQEEVSLMISYPTTALQLLSTRRLSANGVLKGLIFANVIVFLLWRVVDTEFMAQNFLVHLDNFKSRRYHTLITSAFSHIGFIHIISNMIGLYFHGKSIGKLLGPEILLMLYLVGAVVGSASFLVHRALLASPSKNKLSSVPEGSEAAAHGASGAVMTIMILDLLISRELTDLLYVIDALLKDINRVKKDSKICGAGHLGGAAVGIIAWALLRKRLL